MDAVREREIRELAARLGESKRHKRIAVVLAELLGELDYSRIVIEGYREIAASEDVAAAYGHRVNARAAQGERALT